MGVLEDLPNDVLRYIICLLPSKLLAVKTRLVSTRWRELWNETRVQHNHGSISVTVTPNLGFDAPVADHHWIKKKPLHSRWRLEFYCPESGRFLVASVGAIPDKLHLDFSNGKFPDDISVWWTCLRLMGLCYLDLPYLGTNAIIDDVPEVALKEDRLSSLPDKVLQQIICLLPIQSVAKTGIVSTRLYDVQYKGVSKYIQNPPLRLVSTRWPCIDHAFDYVWSTFLEFMVSYIPYHPPITSILLTSVVDHRSQELVSILLSNSRFSALQRLDIRSSQALSNLNLFGLKKLTRLPTVDDCGKQSFNIFLYHKLISDGYREGKRLHVTNISAFHRVEDIMLDLREGPMTRDVPLKYQLLFILRSIRKAKHITMCRWMFEDMIRKSFSACVKFNFLTELWWIDSAMEEENIDSLIAFLDFVPLLEKLFVTVDPKCYRIPRDDKGKNGKCTHGYLMLFPIEERLPRLEMVKMDGFEHEEDEMRLARHMIYFSRRRPSTRTLHLDTSIFVPTVLVPTLRVVATSQKLYPGRMVEISPNLCRRFVNETDIEKLNSKHMHMSI